MCLSCIENKSYSELIECNNSDYDENPGSPMSNTNLADIMIDNEITNVSQEVENLCEHNQVLQEKLDKSEKRNQEEFEKATQTIIDLKLQVEEATRIKEPIANSLKDKLEKSATNNERNKKKSSSEKENYKTDEILVDKLRRKQ